jgi:hypothetical protein
MKAPATTTTRAEYTPPPGWPITDKPLRIAIVGWARLPNQGREGSGYNLSASELASGLALSGHTVLGLSCGVRYSLIPGIRIRKGEDWRNIACYEIVNSPHLAPAVANFPNAPREVASTPLTSHVISWLDEHDIQIVHVHSLEGYTLDLIGAIEASGRPVVVTLHNYWFVCPQVDLFYNDTGVCDDYKGGTRCTTCVTARPPAREKLKRRILQTASTLGGPRAALLIKLSAKAVADRVSAADNDSNNGRRTAPANPELPSAFDVSTDPFEGRIEHNLQPAPNEDVKDPGRMRPDENERFLGADHHLTVLNDYARRRIAGVEALNAASLVTAPSDYLRRAHESLGVAPDRTRTVRLGQPHFDQIHRRAKRSPYYDVRPWSPSDSGPLRLGFFGTTRANKGFEVLVRAIDRLPRNVRQRCQFQLHVQGWDWPYKRRLARYPEVSYAGGYDLYQLIGAGAEYHVGILTHIWLENSPLVLLEHLHAGRFVISSRLGGPPEWIVEPGASADHPLGNGLMFPGGHDDALAESITRIVSGDVVVPSPAEVHAATDHLQSYPGHVTEFESIYRALLDARS